MGAPLLHIDGSHGEGGGQILRSALSCSLITGIGFTIEQIRAKRTPPGLKAQHLEAVRAATQVGEAAVRGDALGSTWLSFEPRQVHGGEHAFRIGTAGATSLVLQTLLVPLAIGAAERSSIRVHGGTHVDHAPSWHYLDLAFRPACARLGLSFSLELKRPGFFPKGGGEVVATLAPCANGLRGTRLLERGDPVEAQLVAAFSGLPPHVAERALAEANRHLAPAARSQKLKVATRTAPLAEALNPGGALVAAVRYQHAFAAYQALAKRGRPAEQLGRHAGKALAAFLAADAPQPTVDAKLADQLLLPAAFAHGETAFRTERVTQHLLSNAEILQRFLPECEIEIAGGDDAANVLVTVRGAGGQARR